MEIDNCTRSTRTFLRKVLAYRAREGRGRTFYGLHEFLILVVGPIVIGFLMPLKILVAVIQTFIFCKLAMVYIAAAVEDTEHH